MLDIEQAAKEMGVELSKNDVKKVSNHELEGVASPSKKKIHAIKKNARKLEKRMKKLN